VQVPLFVPYPRNAMDLRLRMDLVLSTVHTLTWGCVPKPATPRARPANMVLLGRVRNVMIETACKGTQRRMSASQSTTSITSDSIERRTPVDTPYTCESVSQCASSPGSEADEAPPAAKPSLMLPMSAMRLSTRNPVGDDKSNLSALGITVGWP